MITVEQLMSIDKDKMADMSKTIDSDDLPQLVEWLSEKDDGIRYQALLLLQNRSSCLGDVYQYWDVFKSKLTSGNSYQRSIGLTLIAENVKWDVENRIDIVIDAYMRLLNDEKPITVRQCIQALNKIIPYKNHLCGKIADSLIAVDLEGIKETMRKLVLLDIMNILLLIERYQPHTNIKNYISNALSGNILDKKSKKQIEAAL